MPPEKSGSVCHIDGIVLIILNLKVLKVLNEEKLFSQIVRIALVTTYFGSTMLVAILFYLAIFLVQ
jgi:hypothetical protein